MLVGYCNGIKFVGGYQFWSNPEMVGTRASIPVVLLNPTFIDIVNLAVKFGGRVLLDANERLHDEGRLPDFLFNSNRHSIQACINAQKLNAANQGGPVNNE